MRSEQVTAVCAQQFPASQIELYFEPTWASVRADHRSALRSAVLAKTGVASAILDLARLPQSQTHSISISHCKGLGGFALASISHSIGLDIEVRSRLEGVHLRLVASDISELQEAPSAAAFWTGKEAAFKCLHGSLQPRGLKDLRIGGWQQLDEAVVRCELQFIGSTQVTGISLLVFDAGDHTIALCVAQKANLSRMGHMLQQQRPQLSRSESDAIHI